MIKNTDSAEWSSMNHEEKNRQLFLEQKRTLDLFLETGAISQAQHDKSLKDLTEKIENSRRQQYRNHAADIHSHIVFGADDGAQTLNEALELLRLDREEGIRDIFATPHYGIENGYAPSALLVRERFTLLAEAAKERLPDMTLHLGTEWYCSDQLTERIRNHEAFPMGESDWYLAEFLEWGETTEPAEVILGRLTALRKAGIHTILAHPERYKAIQQDWNLAKRICDLGVLLQVNAYDLFLNPKDATRNLAQWMAKDKLISFLGSDMHGTRPGKRTPRMKEGIQWLYENVDEEYANDIVRRNAGRYLGI